MSKKELARRYALFIVSLFFIGLGIALTKRSLLGITPISAVPNILSLRFPALTLGSWLFGFNCLFVITQILLLRKGFPPIQLLQIPMTFLSSCFTDLGVWLVSVIPNDAYAVRLTMVVLGTAVLGFGITLSFTANVVMNPAEAFVKTVSDLTEKNVGSIKIVLDVSCVLASVVLSLLLFDGSIQGTREGTLIAAIGSGLAVKFFKPLLTPRLNRILTK